MLDSFVLVIVPAVFAFAIGAALEPVLEAIAVEFEAPAFLAVACDGLGVLPVQLVGASQHPLEIHFIFAEANIFVQQIVDFVIIAHRD